MFTAAREMAKPPAEFDIRRRRPAGRAQQIAQIRSVFAENDWNPKEQKIYLRSLGIEPRPADKMSDEELGIILADLEKSRMILYLMN